MRRHTKTQRCHSIVATFYDNDVMLHKMVYFVSPGTVMAGEWHQSIVPTVLIEMYK